MHRAFLAFSLLFASVLLVACDKRDIDKPAHRILIPNQEGLEDGLEFRFEGIYQTPIGAASVTGDLFDGGDYEVVAGIGPFSAYLTIGVWEYADGVFTLTDYETAEKITSDKNGETYSFPVYLNDTEIILSATTNGFKEYVIPEPDEDDDDEVDGAQPLSKALLSTSDSEDQALRFELFEDGSSKVVNASEAGDSATGNWAYSNADGFQLTIEDTALQANLENGNYEFEAAVGDTRRNFSIPQQALQSAAAGEIAIIFPTDALPDRYGDFTPGEWEDLWAENDFEAGGTTPLADYPATPLDGTFLDVLPREYFTPVPPQERGSVVRLDYETYLYQLNEDYAIAEDDWATVVKTSYVYLPADYDENTAYNVYYLMHGAGGSPQDWFRMNLDGGTTLGNGDLVMLLDYLIANRLMEPTIFVSVTPEVDKSQLTEDLKTKINPGLEIANFLVELERDLIPAVEGYFGSYLNSSSEADIAASREHRAFGGLSMGAYVTWQAMASNIDSIAYYAPQANGASQVDDAYEMDIGNIYMEMREGDNGNYDIGFLFSHVGVKDHTWDAHIRTNNKLFSISAGDLVYGENFYLHTPANSTHTAKYFILGVYNSMLVFFQKAQDT